MKGGPPVSNVKSWSELELDTFYGIDEDID